MFMKKLSMNFHSEGEGEVYSERERRRQWGEGAKFFYHSIRYMGPFLWSKLSKDLKELPNVATFRNKKGKLDFWGYLSNDSNRCNLCGQLVFRRNKRPRPSVRKSGNILKL